MVRIKSLHVMRWIPSQNVQEFAEMYKFYIHLTPTLMHTHFGISCNTHHTPMVIVKSVKASHYTPHTPPQCSSAIKADYIPSLLAGAVARNGGAVREKSGFT